MPPDTTTSDASGSSPHGTEPLACVACRSRKLKCDRIKPKCTRCSKVSNDCVYPESRRKPTFKRRNVKELEARLAQVEDFLKEVNRTTENRVEDESPSQTDVPDMASAEMDQDFNISPTDQIPNAASEPCQVPQASEFSPHVDQPGQNDAFFEAQLIGLGMSEALPPPEVIEELHNIYFSTHHYIVPIIHPGRYFHAFYGSPLGKPSMGLQYMIWALSAMGHPKYDRLHDVFYRRARQYTESDEMTGDGDTFVSISHAQAWALIATYEAKNMIFTRATTSGAKYVRLCHMMGLDRLDGDLLGMAPTLGPPLSFAELEERRRVFWGAFVIDGHATISTGWPSLLNIDDVATRLPTSEEAFQSNREEKAPFINEVYQGAAYSGFSGTIVVCQIFKTIMNHIHRSRPGDGGDDLVRGTFWTRHRDMDNTLSNIFMFLPDKFRLPQNIRDPVAAHTNLNLHASIICLHHAAVEKVDKHKLPSAVKDSSIARLKTSAEAVVKIIRSLSPGSMTFKSPLCALSLYCATTVYVYLAKSDPKNVKAEDLLNMGTIVQSMEIIARQHAITRAFLQQACLDIERNGLDSYIQIPNLKKYRDISGEKDPKPNIPMLARNSVSGQQGNASIISGRSRNNLFRKASGQARISCPAQLSRHGRLEVEGTNDCFQAVLGAVTRNVAPALEPINEQGTDNNKRKRASPSPATEAANKAGESASYMLNNPFYLDNFGEPQGPARASSWAQNRMAPSVISLPDRTGSSSASSPAHPGSEPKTVSGSSYTSSGVGLGNTPEENRIDLSEFQDRISTPIWQTAEQDILAQMSASIAAGGGFTVHSGDPWEFMNTNIDWSEGPAAG